MKPSFSFLYDGIPFSKLEVSVRECGNDTVYTLPDGLILTVLAEYYPQYGITKWTNFWENPTEHDSGMISELCDCDIELPFERDPAPTRRKAKNDGEPDVLRLYVTNGANVKDDDHWIFPYIMRNGDERRERCICGRSGMGTAPFFEVGQKSRGVLAAIGWSGEWNATFNRYAESFRIRTGIENVSFSMHPGERFRTSAITLLEYENGRDEAHNAFRRYMREVISPFAKSNGERGEQCPFSAIFWGGIPSDRLIDRWKGILGAELPFDTCWIDAGWYEPLCSMTTDGQLADWQKLGDWRPSKFYHPDGYRDVTKYLHANNIDFMAWMEPERIKKSVKAWTKYIPDTDPNADAQLIALNEDEVCNDVIEMVSKTIRDLSLKVYRQDFNMNPYPFWQANDARQPDGERRRGTTEIHYINNMYRFWDTLLERFPMLLIDDCCGGGHRMDIELLSRSVPLWRSDYQCTWDCSPEANQNQNSWASYWYPYTGIGFGPTLGDTYNFRSAWTNGMTVRTWEHVDPEWEFGASHEPIEWAKRNFDQYNRLRVYFSKDFYPLIPPTTGEYSWLASQYNDKESGSGMILAFRRALSPYNTAEVSLSGLDADKTYSFTDEDTGNIFEATGKEAEKITLTIAERRKSLLITYKFKP